MYERQPLGQMLRQPPARLLALMPCLRHHVGEQPGLARVALPRHDCGPSYARMLGKHGGNLAWFDAVAVDLELLIDAAEKLEQAVISPPHEVARSVATGLRRSRCRIGNETQLRLLRQTHVAERHSIPTGDQLSHHADRQYIALAIEHLHGAVADRPPDRHRAARRHIGVRDRMAAGKSGVLGGSVGIHEPHAGQSFQSASDVGRRERLATDQDLSQPGKTFRALVHQHVEQRCGQNKPTWRLRAR